MKRVEVYQCVVCLHETRLSNFKKYTESGVRIKGLCCPKCLSDVIKHVDSYWELTYDEFMFDVKSRIQKLRNERIKP